MTDFFYILKFIVNKIFFFFSIKSVINLKNTIKLDETILSCQSLHATKKEKIANNHIKHGDQGIEFKKKSNYLIFNDIRLNLDIYF